MKKKKLDPLPESKDKFWDKADVNTIKLISPSKCDHEFIRSGGREVCCKHCNIGFFVGNGSEFKDGHIYIKGKLAI